MTTPPLVSVADFETRLGVPLDLADRSRAEALLADVSAEVRAVTGRTFVADEVPELVAGVTLHAALSYWRNPSGYSGETIGAYSYTVGRTTGSTSVGMYLNEGHVATLRPYALTGRGLRSVPLTSPRL